MLEDVATDAGYKSLHSFGKGNDGQRPQASLINVNGVLYGTTYMGGAQSDGTAFSLMPTGAERVLYSFQGGSDGANPSSALLAFGGTLYGTTEYGGQTFNAGTVFKLSPDGGEEMVLHNFGPAPVDGLFPVASLIELKHKLYGTTSGGGTATCFAYNCGTVYRISTNGEEKVLHSFAGLEDGAIPRANLVDVKGVLYGTTEYGGGQSTSGSYGTVFSITTTGIEKVLYNSPGGSGATIFLAGLINLNDTLYGTSAYGGAYGSGTIFSITSTIPLTILHSFGLSIDGENSYASLLAVRSTLYGTTSDGGAYGKGTVFSMTLTGKEKVLHSFGYGSDGATPLAGLIDVNGTLYGTTSAGGTHGDGTIFALRIKR